MKPYSEDSAKKTLRDIQIGENVKFFDFVNAYECSIDDNTKVGTFVEIQKNATIGKNCKISSHTFICEGVHIGDDVFVGHNVSFINTIYPRSVNEDGSMQTERDWQVVETFVEDGASLGTSSTIMAGLTIGKGAIVGAGAVVTRDVPAHTVVAGVPAKVIRKTNGE